MSVPPVKKLPEGKLDPSLGFDANQKGPTAPPLPIGKEPWRDGPTDDGEQGADEALPE